MHKRRTRKKQIAIRFFTYGMMTLLAVVGVVFCLAYAMGFRIDWNDGRLTQVALLQFSSFPTGATIDINGRALSSTTPTRSNVKTGETTVIMSKDGYRSWRKTVDMLPSSVVWLNYARLVPNSITTDTTKNFTAVAEMRESPNKRWLILRHTDNNRHKDDTSYILAQTREEYLAMPFPLTLIDISNPKNVRFLELTIPSDKITLPTADQAEKEKFSIIEWDQGSRFILVEHVVGEMTEYIVLDRANPGTIKNLTRDFGFNLSRPHFSGTSGNVFFGLTEVEGSGADLRKLDYGNKTASVQLAKNVQNYWLYESGRLALVFSENKGGQTIQNVGIYNDGSLTTVKTYSEIEETTVLLTRFSNVDYLVVARGESVGVYPRPLDQDAEPEPIYLQSPGGIDWINLSPNGQFVLAGHGDQLVSFDLDTMKKYAFEVAGLRGAPQWLDNSHIVSTSGGNITFIEFDGQNREDIVSARGRVGLSRDGKYLFSIGETANGVILQRSQLVID
ncbi:PEGA domain-containing protein [Candidatus Saccharibacteria bacterium]|nr:PEGA domain-containing protein [Candidatus Saccharibacteria bacterium]